MENTSGGFWMLMSLLFILGFCNNIYQGSLSGFIGQFPGKYTSYYFMGTGFAGLLMNILRALAILSFSNTTGGALIGIIVYFSAAGLIMLICVVIHPFFTRSEFCRYHLGQVSYASVRDGSLEDPLTGINASVQEKPRNDLKSVLAVFKKVWFFVLLLFVNYVVSFLTYPGVIFEKPIHSLSTDWKNVSMLAAFNIFDVVGKNLAQYRHMYNKWTVIGIIFSRVLCDAFFIIEAITSSIPVLTSTWFAYLNIAYFGLTNGFVTTALFIFGPERVEGRKKEIAGFLSILGLTTGVITGGFLALPLAKLNANNQ